MQEAVKQFTDSFANRFGGSEEHRELLSAAVAIATVSLEAFTGTLLEKGLVIAKAIADFDVELRD